MHKSNTKVLSTSRKPNTWKLKKDGSKGAANGWAITRKMVDTYTCEKCKRNKLKEYSKTENQRNF